MIDSWKKYFEEQRLLCKNYQIDWVASEPHLRIGLADNVLSDLIPVNGLRHPIENGTTGWYIWSGEVFSEDADFFKPYCVDHLPRLKPLIIPFLGLPPGYRFLIDGKGYVDVWEDTNLLLP